MIKDYQKYFDLYPTHDNIDFDIFASHFASTWHNVDLSSEDKKYYCENVIPKLKGVPAEDYEKCLVGLLGRDALTAIEDRCNTGFDVNSVYDICKEYERKYNSITKGKDTDLFHIDDLDFSLIDGSSGLKHALPELQAQLGGMVQGQFIVVAAASGVGKSAYCITQCVETFKGLRKDQGPILYFNSEGSMHGLYGRFLANLYAPKLPNGYHDVLKNQDKIVSHFKSNYDSTKFMPFPCRGIDLGYIRNKVEKYQPSLIIIDLLDAMRLNSNMSEARGYEQLYLDLRDLSSTSCPIIGTSQAGDSAHYYDSDQQKKVPKRWLSEKDLYFSNSGKQGAADTLIMIGMDSPHTAPRYVSVVKNKAGAGEVKVFCELVPKYSLYREID